MSMLEIIVAVAASIILFASGLWMGLVLARDCIRDRQERTQRPFDAPVPVDWFIE